MSAAAKGIERLDPSVWKIIVVAALGPMLSQLDATIVNVSLSPLATEFRTGLSTIQWVTSGYLLALTLVLPLNGWLVDRIGAKRLYLCCFSSFALSSALCGLAWSAPALISFRVLQGVSGGLLAPMMQMMMARAAGGQMARVAGYAAAPILLAPILGPVIAGAILHYASWRWLFLVNLPVGAGAVVLAQLFLPDDREDIRPRELDLAGLALLSPGLVLFLYGSDRLGDRSGLATMAGAVVLLATFTWAAHKKKDRALIDLRLFKGGVFRTAAVTQFLSNGALFSGQMLIPFYLIHAAGRSPGEMGLLLLPMGLGMMCTYPQLGSLTQRFGLRRVSAAGALLAMAGTLPFAYLARHGFNLWVLVPALFIRGAGQGAVGIPSMTAAYASIPRPMLPMATTTLNIVQRLGGPTFTTACATFLSWQLAGVPAGQPAPDAYALVFLILAGLHALTAAAAFHLPLSVRAPS